MKGEVESALYDRETGALYRTVSIGLTTPQLDDTRLLNALTWLYTKPKQRGGTK